MADSGPWHASLSEHRTAWIVACCCIATILLTSIWPDIFKFEPTSSSSDSAQPAVELASRFAAPKKEPPQSIKKHPQQIPDTNRENAAVVRKIKPVISNNAQQQAPATQVKKAPASSSGYYVQAGAFKEKILAQKLLNRMKANGWNAIIVPKSDFHAVWVGPENSRSGIEALQKSIDRTLKIKGFIVQKRPS